MRRAQRRKLGSSPRRFVAGACASWVTLRQYRLEPLRVEECGGTLRDVLSRNHGRVPSDRREAILRELEPTIAVLARRAARTGGGRDEPNDVAQVLRETVVRNVDAYEAASKPLRFVMLRAVALSHARTSRRRAKREVMGLPEEHASVACAVQPSQLEGQRALDRLGSRLAALTPTQLRVVLDVLEGRTSADTAMRMGLTDETVRWHRSRAVKSLGEGLGECALEELEEFAASLAGSLDDSE